MDLESNSFEAMRRAMVDSQLRTSDVTDRAIVAAMAAVPREAFVPPARARVAYTDRAIPLAGGRSLNPPLTTGRLLVAARVRSDDRVLLVGAATGYTAALLARLAGSVVALESDTALADGAAAQLGEMPNVEIARGALERGWPAGAPYSLIYVDGAVEAVPDGFADQLAPGGRVVAALNDRGVTRVSRGVAANGRIVLTAQADIEAAPLPGFAAPPVFTFS